MRKTILGVAFDDISHREAIQRVMKLSLSDSAHYLVTPNVDHIVRLDDNRNLKRIYSEADVCLNDSRILAILSRLMGFGALGTVAGSDLTRKLFENELQKHQSITIIGSEDWQIELLRKRYNIKIQHFQPSFGFYHSVSQTKALIVWLENHVSPLNFICVGAPQSEAVAYIVKRRNRSAGLFLCVGASINFITGVERRAPRIIRDLALEWLFRLAQSPKRLAYRYLIRCPKIFLILIRYRPAEE